MTLHESTVDSLIAALTALAEMCEPGAEVLTAEQRAFLSQAMDTAADLDLLFGELATAVKAAFGPSTTVRVAMKKYSLVASSRAAFLAR